MDGLKLAVAAASLALAAAPLAQADDPMVRFGVITDTHHTDRPNPVPDPGAGRFYQGALNKTESFATAMNAAGAEFVVELGDFTDIPNNRASQTREQNVAQALGFAEAIEAKFALFNGPRYHVFGNHDTDFASKAEYLTKVTNTNVTYPGQNKFYYSFDRGGAHFVVIDASYRADGSHLEYIVPNGYTWLETYVPQHELDWLAADLAANDKPTIIFNHQLINNFPVPGNNTTDHSVKNAAEVRNVLEADGQVIGVLQGHWHGGGVETINGIPYVIFRGNVELGSAAALYNQHAVVDVLNLGQNTYRLTIDGFGMQEDVQVTTTIAPEPAALALLLAGSVALLARRARR